MGEIVRYTILSLLFLVFIELKSQEKQETVTIAFYNVENLFDTIKSVDIINGNLSPNNVRYQISIAEDSAVKNGREFYYKELLFDSLKGKVVSRKHILSDQFHSKGTKKWNSERYVTKIKNIAKVLSEVGKKETNALPVVIGLCEVENEIVLQDLCEELKIYGREYGFVHYNSLDSRGMDVALLYDKKRFKIISSRRFPVSFLSETGYLEYSRDILLVEGELEGDRMSFFVNHWPSRVFGEEKTNFKRLLAAETLKSSIDSVFQNNAKIIIMGDFNDNPDAISIKQYLNTTGDKEKLNGLFFNPTEKLFGEGLGTFVYNKKNYFFDQQIFSSSLIDNKKGYYFYKTSVYSPSYLRIQEGTNKGYPFRTFLKNKYTGGYSDHFPVYSILVKESN